MNSCLVMYDIRWKQIKGPCEWKRRKKKIAVETFKSSTDVIIGYCSAGGLICISMKLRLAEIISLSSILWPSWSLTGYYCYNVRVSDSSSRVSNVKSNGVHSGTVPVFHRRFMTLVNVSVDTGFVFLFILIELLRIDSLPKG